MKTLALTLVLLASATAHADMLVWSLKADCPVGSNMLTLSMTYSSAPTQSGMPNYEPTPERTAQAKTLFACGGTCSTAAIEIPVWVEPEVHCSCFPPRADGSTEGPCETNQYQKCATTVHTQVSYRCDELAHQKLCVSDTCKDSWSTYGDDNPCVELKPRPTAAQCLAGPGPAALSPRAHHLAPAPIASTELPLDEQGGCSIAPGAGGASSLLLLLAAGLLVLRRTRR
jgi:MYXO-CTERM domain-containing protein